MDIAAGISLDRLIPASEQASVVFPGEIARLLVSFFCLDLQGRYEFRNVDIAVANAMFRDDLRLAADHEKEHFQQALKKYQALTAGSKYHTGFGLAGFHTWEEVLESISEASGQYSHVQGAWGKIRKCCRPFGQSHQVFQAWAEVLPSQNEYLSIICGGLKLIVGVSYAFRPLVFILPSGRLQHVSMN